MKFKIIAIFTIIFLIVGGIFLNNYYKETTEEVYHQHLEDNNNEIGCQYIENCSHLPIINIDTLNQQIPTIKNDEKSYIDTEITIYDGGKHVSILGINGTKYNAKIRIRGRSSYGFNKRSYAIKLLDENNKNLNAAFLGMPEDNNWVLYGPYLDRTLIRNYMWYNISQEIMTAAPQTRFVELYINKEYKGLYLAVEAVSQNEKSRVKITKQNKDSIATSYILQLDENKEEDVIIESRIKTEYPLTIEYPKIENLSDETIQYINDDYSKIEEKIHSGKYKEYSKYIDVYSFADYFIINEFTLNLDMGTLSTYLYKDVSGKLKPYVWDFNLANNNYDFDQLEKQSFVHIDKIWYRALLRSPEFVEIVIDRYKKLRTTYLSEKYLFNYIDTTVTYLGPAIDRNYEVWDEMLKGPIKYMPTVTNPRSHKEAISQLKDAIHQRGKWMDENIESLRNL